MKKLLWISALIMCLTSCNRHYLALNPAQTKEKYFSAEMADPPNFTEMTFGMAMANAVVATVTQVNIGGSTSSLAPAIYENEKSFADFHMKRNDPTGDLLDGVADNLTNVYGIEYKKDATVYHLRAQTVSWGIIYHPLKVTQYSIYYNGMVELTDKRSGNKKTFNCHHGSDSKYSYDEVYAHNARNIQIEISNDIQGCVKDIIEDIGDDLKKDTGRNNSTVMI